MGDTSNGTWRFKQTGILFTDTELTLPTGCVNEEERGLGLSLLGFSLSGRRSSHRDADAPLAFLDTCSHRKQSPTPVSAYLLPRVMEGQESLPVRNWALTVFYIDCGGRGPALHPTEMAHMLLHFRSTRVADHSSSLDTAIQYQYWKHLEPGRSLLGSSPCLLPSLLQGGSWHR